MPSAGSLTSRDSRLQPGCTPERTGGYGLLFLASFAALYFELLVIRYLSTEIRIFAYLKNMPLVASFLGIGMGMILGRRTERMRAAFPGLATFFFAMIWGCTQIGSQIGIPYANYGIWQNTGDGGRLAGIVSYYTFVGGFLYLVVRFFVPLGGMVGEYMDEHSSALRAYAVNLLGSFAGIAAFTLLSFSAAPPWIWLCVGFAALLPMLPRNYVTVGLFTAAVLLTSISPRDHRAHAQNYWSPYYHISLVPGQTPADSSQPAYYRLQVNYDYHQTILNLSNKFLASHSQFEPNRSALLTYNLPFQLAPAPKEVLIVGSGTGNDVAAALRNGAGHVDAVEIDPTILRLGRRFHPEHPYDSPRVTTYVNDARAFFKQAPRKYDLIIFAYLDSHTMFSSFSSLRLDNYVYTKESLQEARNLLEPDGTLVLAFASGQTILTARIFATMQAAFGIPPRAIETGYDGAGVVFVEGKGRDAQIAHDLPDLTSWAQSCKVGITTDSWPFLYLTRRAIPWPVWTVLLLFVAAGVIAVRKLVLAEHTAGTDQLHFFLLGAGFLLLETRGVTELSLLFGSTWVVNSIVIGAFLGMALLSNLLVMKRAVPYSIGYGGLFVSALLSTVFPYASLNSHPLAFRIVAAALVTALPVFFSGMVFSRSLSGCANASQALGVNLLGAICGGTLESAVMIGGTGVLGPLALLLYLGSAMPLLWRRLGVQTTFAVCITEKSS